jgi:hypothetical protein
VLRDVSRPVLRLVSRSQILQQGKMPMHQAFDVPRKLVHRSASPFRRIHRACATAVYVIVAFIAVLPSLMLTFLALVGAVWIKQFF